MTAYSATDRYESLLKLSPSQSLAADVLYMGGTHQEAADAAGVNRVTVTRWVHHHPAFVAEMTRRTFERYECLASRAETVSERAIGLVLQAIENGDLSTALTWLRLSANLGRLRDLATPTQDVSLTPTAIINKASESAALHETFEMFSSSYRGGAIDRIHAELEGA
jgi:hypothetical protein